MRNEQLVTALERIAERINIVNNKKYWMIRTDNGANFDTFIEGGFVALNLRNYPTQFIAQFQQDYPNVSDRVFHIKQKLIELNRERIINIPIQEHMPAFSSNIGRLAKQISTIAYTIKKEDIVLIPDRGANRIRIGRVTDDSINNVGNRNNNFSFSRSVEWIKEIKKYRLDPCLYKALGAHQAICDISKYSEYIERNYISYFAVNDTFHYVLAVNAENISAWKLTNMVYDILNCVKTISEENDLGINVEDINFTINVNSPGKFSFLTTARNAVLIMAVVAALSGGSIRYNDFEIATEGAFGSLVECINTWKNAQQDREQKARIFDALMDSLELQSVEASNDEFDEEEQNLED